MKTEATKPYHHGDLRNALIIAAAQLISESGSLEFAMIDAARRAGVSNAAPYRHFKDKDALLTAVAELGFLELRGRIDRTMNAHVSGTREAIIAHGKTYIQFLLEHPAFYSLMWGERASDEPEDSQKIRTSGFYSVVEAIETWCSARELSAPNPEDVAIKLWAMCHGLTVLAMHHQIDRFSDKVQVYDLAEASANTFLDGLEHNAL